MSVIGIIDMGSNSIRLVLFSIKNNKYFNIIDELKESVRLAEGMENDGMIKPEKINDAVKTIKIFKQLCNTFNAEKIIPVATAAVRTASNQHEILNKIKKETGILFRVLTGDEECFYDYFGVINSLDERNGLIVDIGGASTELIHLKNRSIANKISIPYGAINLTQLFNTHDMITDNTREQLITYLTEKFQQIPWLRQIDSKHIIGIGGTIRNIGKIHREFKKYPLNKTHNYKLKTKHLKDIYENIISTDYKGRLNIQGLSQDRVDIFPAAATILTTLIDYCEIKEITISGSGIREGLFYEYIRDGNPSKNVHSYSVRNILKNFGLNEQHAENVYRLTKSIYNQINDLVDDNRDASKIIRTAAMLHDCGVAIRYYKHHKHSFYIITHAGINGLTHKELIISAYIAASHRHSNFKPDWKKYKKLISKKDQKFINKLGMVLRIAESLDKGMTSAVDNVSCSINNDNVIMKVKCNSNADLEINHAMECCDDFKELFKKNLVVLKV